MAGQVDHSNPITLSRFILAEKDIQGNADLCILFSSIELACKVIASAVRRAGLSGLYGLDGSENSTGDAVKKLDVLANDIFINSLKVCTMKSCLIDSDLKEASFPISFLQKLKSWSRKKIQSLYLLKMSMEVVRERT
jgi:fructose-1,6-bisphosphatase I